MRRYLQTLTWLYKQARNAESALAYAENRPGVTYSELEALRDKKEIIEDLIELVKMEGREK